MRVETVLGPAVVETYIVGHHITTTKVEREGPRVVRYWTKPLDDIHAVEIRLEPSAGQLAGKTLWHGTVVTALGGVAQLPEEATIFLNALRKPAPKVRGRMRTCAGRGEPERV